jgi:hypothetical protein
VTTAVVAQDATSADGIAEARATVLEQRAILVQWEEKLADCRARISELQDTAGEEVLDAPDSAAAVARELTELRDIIAITQKAIDAQKPRISAAESRYLKAEADLLELQVDVAETALQAHRTKVTRLLDQLAALDGPYVPEIELLHLAQRFDAIDDAGKVWREPMAIKLVRNLQAAQRRVTVVREMAAGRDPQPLVREWGLSDPVGASDRLRYYPDCVWRPDALVPAPALVGARGRAERWLEELEALQDQLPDHIAELRTQIHGTPLDDHVHAKIERAQGRLDALPGLIAEAAALVAALAVEDLDVVE